MRGSFTGGYVRRTGDTMTGALTIATDTTPGLIIDRPDGSDYRAMDIRRAGTMVWHFFETLAEPRIRIRNAGSAERVNIQTTDGKLTLGVVPLARMQVSEVSAQNAALITVTAGGATIATLAALTVAVGDRVLVAARAQYDKGVTAGLNSLRVIQSGGTAAAVTYNSAATIFWQHDTAAANGTSVYSLFGIFKVTGAGTLPLVLDGTSGGSNSTVQINLGQIHALHLQGT